MREWKQVPYICSQINKDGEKYDEQTVRLERASGYAGDLTLSGADVSLMQLEVGKTYLVSVKEQ